MRMLGGVAVAMVIAVLMSNVALFGVELWKIALALAGVAIFVLGGRR
jgi:type IV secretory pathway TrbD component